MNISKNNLLIWSVILLVIANVAVLVTIWSTHRKQGPGRGTPADYLIKELNLNSDQQNKLRSLAKQHHEQSLKIREGIKSARHDLFKLLQQPAIDDSTKRSAADNVAKDLEQLDLLTFDHFKEVRSICTPEQQKKFDKIIEDVLQMIASGPPGRGPRHGEHMPPPEH
ncbi:MAG TPA: periplasmic heavy metal sensor [Chitinophagaceae bacterium]|nr:periplasmic heavy metal sensor [Chitinophagaceae bacterium]